MALGTRKQRVRQETLWIAKQELPASAAHPFYARLNELLEAVLLAHLAAVLPGDANGVFAFFGEAGIVDDPSRDGIVGGHLGQNVVADGLEEKLVIPGRYGDDVMQGLMSAPDVVGVKTSGHGFHAFALSGQEEAEAVAD